VLIATRDWTNSAGDVRIDVSSYSAIRIIAKGADGSITNGVWDNFDEGYYTLKDVEWNGLTAPSNIEFNPTTVREANVLYPWLTFSSQTIPIIYGLLEVYGKKSLSDSALTNAQLRASPVPISGTVTIGNSVTANNPNGTLTTRFGSVVTANSVLATTCVTNASRKYLIVQNNQTGTSAGTVTIGIGFVPTTTQGIQLISGASYTADSFVPTGAIYWLGSVTGANFTILEG
jgi:hypothetical protein